MRLAPASLTGRLVATAVVLVALVAALVSAATALAMRGYLTDRLDAQVRASVERSVRDYSADLGTASGGPAPAREKEDSETEGGESEGGEEEGTDDDAPAVGEARGQSVGTLTAAFDDYGVRGNIITEEGRLRALPRTTLRVLRDVPDDGRPHEVALPGLGGYRVVRVATEGGSVLGGLSTDEIEETLESLVMRAAALTAAGVAVAGLGGWWLVRRQLRPLRDVAQAAHEVTAMPLTDGAVGTTVRVPGRLADERTEVGQVGAALNTMLAHVEDALDQRHRSEQQVRQFVADASHELRTPLATIHGYAELSRRTDPPDPEQLALALRKVESEADRMSALVEDLLLLARLDAGRPLARDAVDLTMLVLEAVDDARVVAPDHRWRLDLPEEPVVVSGDAQRLHQVLSNLLGNARRHTPAGTSVTVGVRAPDGRAEDGRAVLTVTDDGPGIPADLAPRVFERFTRGDSARTRTSGGAGLGLSLVQAIVAAHGGEVGVTSTPGRTCFEVRLPAAPRG